MAAKAHYPKEKGPPGDGGPGCRSFQGTSSSEETVSGALAIAALVR